MDKINVSENSFTINSPFNEEIIFHLRESYMMVITYHDKNYWGKLHLNKKEATELIEALTEMRDKMV